MHKFKTFLESLKTDTNSKLIDSIIEGYDLIEGFTGMIELPTSHNMSNPLDILSKINRLVEYAGDDAERNGDYDAAEELKKVCQLLDQNQVRDAILTLKEIGGDFNKLKQDIFKLLQQIKG